MPHSTNNPTPRELDRARLIARVMDTALPLPGGTRVGLDALLGLVPGFGDLAGAAGSLYIVILAIRAGASRSAVVRMIANIGVDTVAGSFPLLGDLFDAGWKSNVRNVAIMERDLGATDVHRHTSKGVLMVMVLGALVLLAGLAYMIGAFLWLVVGRLF